MSSSGGRGKRGYSTDSSRDRLADSYFGYGNKDKVVEDVYLSSRQKDIYINDDYSRDGKHEGGYEGGRGGGYHAVGSGFGYELYKKMQSNSILAFAMTVGYFLYTCFVAGSNCLGKKRRRRDANGEDLGEEAAKMEFIYGLIDRAESLWGMFSGTDKTSIIN